MAKTRIRDFCYLVAPHGGFMPFDALPVYPRWEHSVKFSDSDAIVFSMQLEQYYFNVLDNMKQLELRAYFCKDFNEFISYMEAYSLGADITALWKYK